MVEFDYDIDVGGMQDEIEMTAEGEGDNLIPTYIQITSPLGS